MGHYLRELIQKHKAGIRLGIFSVCSANEFVLESLLEFGRKHDQAVLIEATSNQVNQYGGYTGMVPRDFVEFVAGIARGGLSQDKVILGAITLPQPLEQEPAAKPWPRPRCWCRNMCGPGSAKFTWMQVCT